MKKQSDFLSLSLPIFSLSLTSEPLYSHIGNSIQTLQYYYYNNK